MLSREVVAMKQGVQLSLILGLSAVLLCTFNIVGVVAQTSTSTYGTNVRGSVPDVVAPSTPVLITPADGTVTSDNTPIFSWYGASDNVGISSYTIVVDGSPFLSGIPITDTAAGLFTVTYNAVDNIYTLQSNKIVPDGSHTWAVTAVDAAGNQTTSASWQLTVDATTPYLIITQAGNYSLATTSQNTASVPTSPLEFWDDNEVLRGSGETGSQVTVSFTRGGVEVATPTMFVLTSPNWLLSLPDVPKNSVIFLRFTITDSVGNISLIEHFPIYIHDEEAPQIDPPPTPNPSNPVISYITPSPSPDITPKPWWKPPWTLQPSPSSAGQEQVGSSQPPKEVTLLETITTPLVTPPLLLPGMKPHSQVIQAAPSSEVQSSTQDEEKSQLTWWSYALPLTLIMFALLKTLVVAGILGLQTSIAGMLAALSAVCAPLLARKRPSLVFDVFSGKPASFMPVLYKKYSDTGEEVEQTLVFSNEDGRLPLVPTGAYSLEIDDAYAQFPTMEERPTYLNYHQFYKGELLETTQESVLSIPCEVQMHAHRLRRVTLVMFSATRGVSGFFWFLFSLGITILYPSFINGIVFVFYLLCVGVVLVRKRKGPFIKVFDQSGAGISHCITYTGQNGDTTAIYITDKNGSARLAYKDQTLTAYKYGYRLMESTNNSLLLAAQ
ncbi:MAG: hypothetical protein H6774_02200 [Pseudomonadales bacterium]|nr:hypothetical protein [Pseudomonadales bacterium]